MKEKVPSEQEVEIFLQPFNILLRSRSAMLDYDLAFRLACGFLYIFSLSI